MDIWRRRGFRYLYEHKSDKGLPGREAFRTCPDSDAGTLPAHYLYACKSDADELIKHLAYRDYLMANPDRAKWLAAHKPAADAASESRDTYIEVKADSYSVFTTESLEWADKVVHRKS